MKYLQIVLLQLCYIPTVLIVVESCLW